MTVRLTAAQARRIGLDPKLGRTRTTRRVAKGGGYHTVCKSCGEDFTSRAAEDRHLENTRHHTYLLVLD